MARLLSCVSLLSVLAVAVAAGTDEAPCPPPAIDKNLLGTWVVEAAQYQGKAIKENNGQQLEFKDDGSVVLKYPGTTEPERTDRYVITKVPGGGGPGVIHITPTGGPRKGTELGGLYKFDKDTLQLCQCVKPGLQKGGEKAAPPNDFTTDIKNGALLLVLKKVK